MKTVEKWAANWDYMGNLVVMQGTFRETEKLFIRTSEIRLFQQLLGYATRFSKGDKRLHDTRRAALLQMLADHKEKLDIADKQADKAKADIRIIAEEIERHDPLGKAERDETEDQAPDESPEG